jgi:hypothetical protein
VWLSLNAMIDFEMIVVCDLRLVCILNRHHFDFDDFVSRIIWFVASCAGDSCFLTFSVFLLKFMNQLTTLSALIIPGKKASRSEVMR